MSFDFNAVSVETVPADAVKSTRNGRSRRVLATPFPAWVAQCKETGEGMRITVPNADAAKEARDYLRAAAELADTGIRTALTENADGSVVVSFKTAPRRAYKPRAEKASELDESMKAHPAGKGRK